jgi:hypothetical protein
MKPIILLTFVLMTFIACQKKESKSPAPIEETKPLTSEKIGKDCYRYEGNGIEVSMQITAANKEIEGYLKYNLVGKDKNKGSFKGVQKGDTLLATYTFQSEGVESKRDIAFLLKNKQLLEGYGEMLVEGTTSKFKNPSQLKFDSAIPLSKVDCKGDADCLVDFGFMRSEIKNGCIELSTLNTRLNPLKNGEITSGDSAFILFSEDQTKAELFLPHQEKGIVLNKTNEGNWSNTTYKLIAWKGYVLQQNGKVIFGGQ